MDCWIQNCIYELWYVGNNSNTIYGTFPYVPTTNKTDTNMARPF